MFENRNIKISDFDLDSGRTRGFCDTCDYGKVYYTEFRFKLEDKETDKLYDFRAKVKNEIREPKCWPLDRIMLFFNNLDDEDFVDFARGFKDWFERSSSLKRDEYDEIKLTAYEVQNKN